MANKVRFGLKNVYIAPLTISDAGVYTYGTPVHLPGAVNLSLSPEGETNPFYADDSVYYRSKGNNGYTGTLEVALIPDWFEESYLDGILDSHGVLVEQAGSQEMSYFAMMFEFTGDSKQIRHVLYQCSAARPDTEGSTKAESIDVQTETLNITVDPRQDNFLVKAKTTDDTATATYSAWYTTVYVPTVDEDGNVATANG